MFVNASVAAVASNAGGCWRMHHIPGACVHWWSLSDPPSWLVFFWNWIVVMAQVPTNTALLCAVGGRSMWNSPSIKGKCFPATTRTNTHANPALFTLRIKRGTQQPDSLALPHKRTGVEITNRPSMPKHCN